MATVHPIAPVVDFPDLELLENLQLVHTDGEPLESGWHVYAITLLIESILAHFRDRTDFYVGGNMFIYFNLEQALNRDFRGPDFFFVDGSSLYPLRESWVVWKEGGRYPNAIIELLSPSTVKEDRTTKKDVYEKIFRTPEYFCYDPKTQRVEGWQLGRRRYVPMQPDERGWYGSEELGLWVGTWTGEYRRYNTTWLRFYDANGQLVLTGEERAAKGAESECQRAESERQRAESERQRAEAAEAELARLKALLAQQGKSGEAGGDASS